MHRIYFVFLLILICRLPAFGQHACEETLKKIPLSNLRAGDFDTDYSEYDDSVCVFTLRGKHSGFDIGIFRLADREKRAVINGQLSFQGISCGNAYLVNFIITNGIRSQSSFYEDFGIANVSIKDDIYFYRDTINKTLSIEASVSELSLRNSLIGRLESGSMNASRIAYIDLSGSELKKGGNFSASGVHYVDFAGLKVSSGQKFKFDFTPDSTAKLSRIPIRLVDADIDKLDFDYKYFKLDTSKQTTAQITHTYEELLKSFRKSNDETNANRVYREYQDWVYRSDNRAFWGKMLWLWNNYGLNPFLPVNFLLGFLILATMVNLFYYQRLNNEVYQLDNFPPYEPEGNFLKRAQVHLYNSFIYTIILFLSINVKFDKLHYRKVFLLAWFLVIYLAGYWFLFLVLKQLS